MQKARSFNLSNGIVGMKISQSGTRTSGCLLTLIVEDTNNATPNASRQIQIVMDSTTWFFDQLNGAGTASKVGEGTGGGLSSWAAGDWMGFGYDSSTFRFYKSSDGQTWTELGHCSISSFTTTAVAIGIDIINFDATGASTWTVIIDEVGSFVPSVASHVMKVRVGGAWVTVATAKVKVRVGGAWVACTPKVRDGGVWVSF